MAARALMFQGTGSDVGKSLVVAGLCRLFARRGLKVMPFKAQNMSNNAAVVAGGEIGRAQWLQALAAGVEPSVHMNPVLLKPQSDKTSQVIMHGKVAATMGAADYQTYRASLMPKVLESYHTLAKTADLILVEGAGSPAEINLRKGDIANMGFAHAANCPVMLIGDIDRGGVIASLVGTHAVLPEDDKKMIRGFLINKFRGDARLFDNGITEIKRFTGWPYLGLIPYHHELAQLPQEDSLNIPALVAGSGAGPRNKCGVVVLTYPHLSNFDDLDPLANEPGVKLTWCKAGEVIPADADMVILPGSKSTIADLQFLRAQGWDIDLQAHVRRGGRVLGLCGGYQMLGKTLSDPQGIEGPRQTVDGLSMLDISTLFTAEKTLTPWQGNVAGSDVAVSGYEMHMGVSTGADCQRPVFMGKGGGEGARSENNLVCGTYLHGVFAGDAFRRHFLAQLGARPSLYTYGGHMQKLLDSWADVLESALDIEQLLSIATPVKS